MQQGLIPTPATLPVNTSCRRSPRRRAARSAGSAKSSRRTLFAEVAACRFRWHLAQAGLRSDRSLELSYDANAGNWPFGFGWSLSLPRITRKTDKGLPLYRDSCVTPWVATPSLTTW